MRLIDWLDAVGRCSSSPTVLRGRQRATKTKNEAAPRPTSRRRSASPRATSATRAATTTAPIESFKAAIAADPKLPGPYRNLGLAYRALNRCTDALPMYEKYLELKPESRFTDRVRREIDLCRAKLGQAPLPPRRRVAHGERARRTRPRRSRILHVAANLIGGEATDEATVQDRRPGARRDAADHPGHAGRPPVHLTRAGFETADATVEVGPGERRDVELTMNKLPDEQPPVAGVDAEVPRRHRAQGELPQVRLDPARRGRRRPAPSAPASASPRASCTRDAVSPIRR